MAVQCLGVYAPDALHSQAPRNITLEQPSQGPPKNTTMGAANAQATKFGMPPVDSTNHINSRAGEWHTPLKGHLYQQKGALMYTQQELVSELGLRSAIKACRFIAV